MPPSDSGPIRQQAIHADSGSAAGSGPWSGQGGTAVPSPDWPSLLGLPPRSHQKMVDLDLTNAGIKQRIYELSELDSCSPPIDLGMSFQLPEDLWFKNCERSLPDGISQHVCQNPESLQRYIDYLVKEIQIFRSMLPRGLRLSYVHWSWNLVKRLTDSELTQLMFHINRAFTFKDRQQARITAELCAVPDDSRLALLTGLGVNALCINAPCPNLPLEQLLNCLNDLKHYGVRELYLRLRTDRTNPAQLNELLPGILSLQPAGILLDPPWRLSSEDTSQQPEKFTQVLLSHNYRPLTDGFFVVRNWLQGEQPRLLKGIGLSAASYNRHLKLTNTSSLPEYYGQLDKNMLPVKQVQKIISECI